MQPVIITMVVMLHAAFGCMFLFVSRQHPGRFARLMAQSWLLEAFRAGINATQFGVSTPGVNHWHSLSDCLAIIATWWLFAGCASLAGVKLPERLGRWYVGISLPLIMGIRYLGWWLGPSLLGVTPERAAHLSVFVELVVIFVPVTVFRGIILWWLLRIWRTTRLPGALLAVVFGVPYVFVALFNPIQQYIGYHPDWIYHLWAARVLGFSLGLMMLLFDRQMAALRASESRMRRFIDSNIQGVLICSTRGEITNANDAFLRIVGYSRAELEAGKLNWQRLTPPEWAALDELAVKELEAHGVCRPWEKEYYRKDGTRVPVLVGVALFEDAREKEEAVAFVLDISERQKAENAVRHLANFPELNPNPVLEFSANATVAYQNPAAQAMVRKLGQQRLEQLLPPDTADIVAQCLASGQPRLRVVTTAGRHTLSWSFYPIVPQQAVHCYIGDITERMQLEEQLRQAQKMEAVGQLAGGVAHDFNNLLTAIIGHAGLIQGTQALPPDVTDSLTEISRAANRAANLTSQLLAFSRLQVINIRALDLNEVVTQLGKMLRRVLGENIAINLDFAPERLIFNGDAGMMEQVVINLAVNARDAMPSGGTLRISTGSERCLPRTPEKLAAPSTPMPFVCLTVSDTGTGIPADILPKIFDPFFTTKEVGKGTGLGLATAFGIVQQHHGWIEVKSEVGRGSTFRLYLPRLERAPDAAPLDNVLAPARGRGEVILLVEDEPAVRDVGLKALRGQGYRVLAAMNGESALEVWAAHRAEIELLLTDIIMPGGVTGLQLARRLQAEKPSLRVVYTSGYSRETAGKELAMDEGVNYLAKPYEVEKLFQIVRDALDGRHSGQPFPH